MHASEMANSSDAGVAGAGNGTGRADRLAGQHVPAVQAVAAISTTVAEMDRSVAFYSGVLSFRKMSDQEIELADAAPSMPASRRRVVRMRLGDEAIELVQFEREREDPFRRIRVAMISGSSTLPSS